MRYFSAQYILTNTGAPLKRGVITTTDDGTITNIEDTKGNLSEKHSLEFFNGIIIPGFVNCHCHLELSHMKDTISRGNGLTGFIDKVRNTRGSDDGIMERASEAADQNMYTAGVNLCADICNTALTFKIKKKSRINYISLLEVFGIDPDKAMQRINDISRVSEIAGKMDLSCFIVPHSVYSVSLPLFRLLKELNIENDVTSIHFMETPDEAELVENHSGPLMTSYIQSGLISSGIDTVKSHSDAILNEITNSGNLILVHNTFADRDTIRKVKKREKLFWCLCPKSNLYIENKIPDVGLLIEENCTITIGTDSLASNNNLNILDELKVLQIHFPSLSITDLISWATLNGAKALGEEESFGKIDTGIKPGLLLLQNADLQNMKLLPESFVTRLI